MARIELTDLHPHPENPNRMSEASSAKLAAHIRSTGRYPPLIVRPHPEIPGHYQVLDGHHRADILRTLGNACADCVIWDVDDEAARMLLLTLNRLQGADDPAMRGALLEKLAGSVDVSVLARWLPDDAERIERLMRLAKPPAAPLSPAPIAALPQPVTFFLTKGQRTRLHESLKPFGSDPSAALARALGLDGESPRRAGAYAGQEVS